MMNLAKESLEQEVILYVDDEDMARKYFARFFAADYAVLMAQDADAAIGILRNRQVGILVTDYRMPGRDGGDLLRQVEQEFPQVVRILVTAYADREVLINTVNSSEVFRIIEKPMDFVEVRKVLRLACDLSRERNARQQRLMAIDETLAFLAHELNTPLAAIVNFARGVQRRITAGMDTPQQQAEVGKAAMAMDDNAQYCMSLLSAFVESVHGAGSSLAHCAGSTAHQMIAILLDTYPLTPEQRGWILLDIREDFRISALPNCILLVLSSILSNALRAIQGQPAPSIRFEVQVEGHPQIRIIDNGPGISPEIRESLLRDPVTTHARSGAKGWGMIFCKRIMESFGGGIQIHSESGTAVTLDFPAIKVKRSDQ